MKDGSLRLFAEEAPRASERSNIQIVRAAAEPRVLVQDLEPSPTIVVPEQPPAALTPKHFAPERDIIEELDAPAVPGELAADAFRRKEHALVALFATLTVEQARLLHRRLSVPEPSDPIAQRFARLVVARRTRLLAFLADAGRRALLARGHR